MLMRTKIYETYIICPECEGKGKVSKREFTGHTSGYEDMETLCPECKGKRILKKRVTTELINI
jgi:DNA-directed RNA polymerase subunit RPC12/RpoP